MFVGHFSAGLLAKRAAPEVSLGTAVLAAIFADLFFPLLAIAGIEQVEFGSGRGAANYFHAINIVYSHSLLMTVLAGAVIAGAYFALRRDTRGAAVLLAAALSHWVFDVISHRPDMPLAPGVSTLLGLGLWTSIPATLVIEGGLWVAALVVYVRASRSRNSAGRWVFWGGVFILTLFWYSNIAGPPPARPEEAPLASLIFFSLTVMWAYWMNRAREVNRLRA
jgi:hypothetical protein